MVLPQSCPLLTVVGGFPLTSELKLLQRFSGGRLLVRRGG